MQTKDTIDIKKELEVLRTAKKELSEQLLKIEGIESYYENLIKKNIVIISEPIPERDNRNLYFRSQRRRRG